MRLSQIRVNVAICLKFKLNACSFYQDMKWDDFPVLEKTTRCRQLGLSHQGSQKLQEKFGTENYLDLSLLICNFSKNVSVWLTASLKFLTEMLLCCLPLPCCFLNVSLPTLLATVLKFLFPLTTSITSGTANSNTSAPTRFAAGTIFFLRKRMAVLPITYTRAPKPRPLCRPISL